MQHNFSLMPVWAELAWGVWESQLCFGIERLLQAVSGLSWPASHEGDCSFLLLFVITAGTLKTTSVMWLLYFNCPAAVSVSLSCTHTRMHTHTHTRMHACTHMHTRTQKCMSASTNWMHVNILGFLIPAHPSCGCSNSAARLFLHPSNYSHPCFFSYVTFLRLTECRVVSRDWNPRRWGEGEISLTTLSLPGWFCVKMGSNKSHFNVSVIMWGKVTEQWVS